MTHILLLLLCQDYAGVMWQGYSYRPPTQRYIPSFIFRIGLFSNSRKSRGIAVHISHSSKSRLVACLKTPPNLLKSIIQSIGLSRWMVQSRVDKNDPHECIRRTGEFEHYLLMIAKGESRSQASPCRLSWTRWHWDRCNLPPPPRIIPLILRTRIHPSIVDTI
jgi:hypothetical protein